jgi:hypothetical protein
MLSQVACGHRERSCYLGSTGLRGLYRHNEINHCPGCSRTNWVIGRFSAECGFCATALPLAETALLGAGTHLRSRSRSMGGEWDVS